MHQDLSEFDCLKCEIIVVIMVNCCCSHLPPSQGGKYAGFGYTKDPMPKSQSHELFDSTVSSLASVSGPIHLDRSIFIVIIHFRVGACSLLELPRWQTQPRIMSHVMEIWPAKR